MSANASDEDVLAFTNKVSAAGKPQPPAAAAGAALPIPLFLGASQRDAANEIRRALAERHVFAAVTGAPGLGKTMVLATAIAAASGALRVIRVGDPNRVSVEQAERLVAEASASPGGAPAVLVIDDADRASSSLLRGLTRIAEASRLHPGTAQVILAGRPELWDRLDTDELAPLRDRIAVRPVLRPMTEEDARGLIRHVMNEPRKIFGQAFADDAEQEVLRLADGRPERIGALVRSTLMLGDLQIRPQLSVDMVHATADMLDGRQQPVSKRRTRILRPAVAAGLAVALTGGLAMAARDGGLERALSAVHDAAGRPVAQWVRQAANGPAPAGQQGPALRPAEAAPPAAPADAHEAGRAPPAPMPAPAMLSAARGDADRPAAEPQPLPQLMSPAPALPEPMPARTDAAEPAPANAAPSEASQADATPPETPDASGGAASAAPAPDEPSPAAESVPSQAASEPVPTIEAAAPPQDAPAERADAPAPPAPALEAAAPEPAPAPQAISAPQPSSTSEPAAMSDAGAGSGAPSKAGQGPDTAKTGLAPDLVTALLRRGDEALTHGDVSAARQFYERTLPTGSALGARGMARTYDPAVLGRGNPAADPNAAAAWYERAARPDEREPSVQHEASVQPPLKAGR